MKILIAGAGAIGGYIGARLAKAGADVVLFARGPHLRAMADRGLRIISPDGDFEVSPQVKSDLSTIGPADVIILGVKAHALTALAPQGLAKSGLVIEACIDAVDRRGKAGGTRDRDQVRAGVERLQVAVGRAQVAPQVDSA